MTTFGWQAWLVPFIAVKSTIRRILGTNRLPMFFSKVALLKILCFELPFIVVISFFLAFLVPLILVSFLMIVLFFSNLSTFSGLILFFLLLLLVFLGFLCFSLEFLITRMIDNQYITERPPTLANTQNNEEKKHTTHTIENI